ncbi:MAG TPA: adenosylcobinamide-GDP ribazoletransferase [Stellaceae bacterium]|nr:adenosylcobinamide-GDP ribazoletransferase [Stellaceae bacterium]
MTAPETAPQNSPRSEPGLYAGFAIAATFLTRVPLAAEAGRPLAAGAWAFPLVGAGVGGFAALALLIVRLLVPGDWPAALAAVLASAAVSGALHEDGLADTADGLLGGHDREARLAIMRDSRHGTYGVLALVFSVLLRAAALAAQGDPVHAALALIAAHAASRAVLPAALLALAPARADGLGAGAGRPRPGQVVAAAALGGAIALAALGPLCGLLALALAGAAVVAAAGLAERRIGGYTGDVLGAFQQLAEIVILFTAAAR